MAVSPAVKAGIESAMSVAGDIAEGRLPVQQLDAEVAQAVRDLAGTVIGPEDPVWPVQVDIARQVLGHGGIPADELAEWLTVQRTSEPRAERVPSWIEHALAVLADGCDGLCATDECVCPVHPI